jgi:hypothetical protein
VLTTSGTYLWSFVTQIFHNGQPSHGGDRKTFEVMTSTLRTAPIFSDVRISRSLVLCVCFVDRCLSFCPFPIGHYVVCPSTAHVLVVVFVLLNNDI